jgi:RND family efflux transporter MFP subunit
MVMDEAMDPVAMNKYKVCRSMAVSGANAALAFTLLGCGGCSVASNPASVPEEVPKAPASVASQPPVVSPTNRGTGAPEILSVLSVEHQVDLATELDGTIVAIYKDEGSLVKAGGVLGQIDDRSMKLELIKAQDDLKASQYNVQYKEAELKAKSAALNRQQQLRQMGISSQADLEAAEFAAKAAEFDLHGWEAQVESSTAEIDRINLLIEKSKLHAPFAGVVVRRYVREGQTVTKGDKCFRVSQLSPLQVQFQIPEASSQRLKIGNAVNIFLLENPEQPLQARITKISPIVDPGSDSYNVTAQLRDSQTGSLRPGMAVRVAWPGPN